ncbi:MAG: 16S rRNA (cytosine(967)-C(5))-methyltransferase RsmB [Candidatus Gastranaerophilales bacterium]|nr:16S rRNA (cytosine(967)-C(5))-methyltransferase RsmB [Candidatus Gastranaerophilales bacterium]
MSTDVRFATVKSLIKILEHDKFFDEVFAEYSEKVENTAELVNMLSGTVKSKLTLDFCIEKASSKNVKRLSPVVRNILRAAIYELEYLNTPDYAVVNSFVGLCRKLDKGAEGFVNGVLRGFIRKRSGIAPDEKELGEEKFLSIKFSHPEWLIRKWLKHYGREKTEKICAYNNAPPKTVLRFNALKTDKNSLIKLFSDNEIEFEESAYCKDCLILKSGGNVRDIPGYREGFWVVQGESSSLVAEILAPQAGERILDMCAAPGGKTTHIAALMGDVGEVVAVDISPERLKKVEENCARLGVKSVKTVVGDGTTIQAGENFDRILVDAPCSNTGVLIARPDARWKRTPEDLQNLTKLQMAILKNAVGQLKTGGTLVYSTCSIEPEENEILIRAFLEDNKAFSLENFMFAGAEQPGMLQILPCDYGIDGFFIVKLRKKK